MLGNIHDSWWSQSLDFVGLWKHDNGGYAVFYRCGEDYGLPTEESSCFTTGDNWKPCLSEFWHVHRDSDAWNIAEGICRYSKL